MLDIKLRLFLVTICILFLSASFTQDAQANHSWGTYHWGRTSNPFTLKLGDSVSSVWDIHLATTSADWSISSVLDTTIVPGAARPRNCRPTNGRIEVCNYRYGNNGWLGLAQIWVSGNHITQGITKVNDTYFNKPAYNTPLWRNFVLCQEVGHIFGLDHQDENFNNANLESCMDYTSSPGTNQHPNFHDYEQLEIIYAHLDSVTTVQSGKLNSQLGLSSVKELVDSNFENSSDWGREIRNNRFTALYERDLGRGYKLFTFTIWARE